MSAKERRPVIVEIAKPRRHIDGARYDIVETRGAIRALERCRPANREAHAFVERAGLGRIERNRGVPEVAYKLHLASVIPHVCSNDAARARHAPHLDKRALRVRNEVQDEAGYHNVKCTITYW